MNSFKLLRSLGCKRKLNQKKRFLHSLNIHNEYWGISNKNDPLEKQYNQAKAWLKAKKPPPDVDPRGIFANVELNMEDIEVYGFDYDYTLASYKTTVEKYIHDFAKIVLVEQFKYPEALLSMEYDPQRSIRGLHYDIQEGLLLKIDSINQIQFGSVFRGKRRLTNEEILAIYKRRRIPQEFIETTWKTEKGHNRLVHLVDIFAKPVVCLLGGVIQYFIDNDINFAPPSMFTDVIDSIDQAHPQFHANVVEDPGWFLEKNESLLPWLLSLKEQDRKIFVITNSPWALVNSGMTFMIGDQWRELFDVIIINAKKPGFFTGKTRHFRRYFPEEKILSWRHVHIMKPGRIYSRGNISDLQELTQWDGNRTLYFGDHPYADLADLSLRHGWRTGAIIKELEDEIKVANHDSYKWNVNWAQILQTLVKENQKRTCEVDKLTILQWKDEINMLRQNLKEEFNPFFGSIFRTHQNSTYFSRRLFRFADVYTSRITNFNRYPVDQTYYPRRGALPHEFKTWFM